MPPVAWTTVTATAKDRGRIRSSIQNGGPMDFLVLDLCLGDVTVQLRLSPSEAGALARDIEPLVERLLRSERPGSLRTASRALAG